MSAPGASVRGLVFRTDPARLVAALAWSRATGRPATFAGGPLHLARWSPAPLGGRRWVRVRTRLGGICGSDLHMLRIEVSRDSGVVATRRAPLGTPVYPGHEACGEVVEMGAEVRGLTLGQRVVLVPGVFCAALEVEPCPYCREGLYSLCRNRQEKPPGFVGAGWSEEYVRHETQVVPVPEEVDDASASLVEPAACALHAVLRRPPAPGHRVLVVGAGMIGLGITAVLRAFGPVVDVTVLARHRFQADLASRLGATRTVAVGEGDAYAALAEALGTRVLGECRRNRYLGDGFDVVYDVVGSAGSLHDALRWCRPRGYVVLVGVELFPGVLDRTPLWRRELDVVGSVGHGDDTWEGTRLPTFQRTLEWMASGRLGMSGLVSRRFPLDAWRQAVEAAASKGGSGVVRVAFQFP